MTLHEFLKSGFFAAATLAILTSAGEAAAPNCELDDTHPKCKDSEPEPEPDPGLTPTYYDWMHSDVGLAFDPNELGGAITGVGSHLAILDNFSGTTYEGNLDGTIQSLTHGGWTALQSNLVAPGATLATIDQPSGRKDRSGLISDHYSADAALQVVNLSFGLFDPVGTVVNEDYSFGYSIWDSLVDEAWKLNGDAVLVKAAGNMSGGTVDEGTMMFGFPFSAPYVDTLNISLIGAQNALFVGALDGNGTVANPASIASYSTISGDNDAVQSMFLVAGVEVGMTGLAGTSFAAPIISGYAALIGDKYYETLDAVANPAELVVDRLLETAHMDRIAVGNSCEAWDGANCVLSTVYGVGEADLYRALAPNSIN